ncbi:hypothetical protein EDC04DRAFT_2608674 [Pisolithus marmoratus]|nr:hypothetical protein EDC04DRAFT_2608674 [Pisolithus marmoratus]
MSSGALSSLLSMTTTSTSDPGRTTTRLITDWGCAGVYSNIRFTLLTGHRKRTFLRTPLLNISKTISTFAPPIPLPTPLQPLQPPHVPPLPPHVPLPPHTSHTRQYGIITFRRPGNLETILVHGRTRNIGEHKGTRRSEHWKISPPNDTTVRLAKGLAEAHKAYNVTR